MKILKSNTMRALFALLVTVPGSAFAQQAYVGIDGGFSVPSYDQTSGRPFYGIVAGAKLDGEFGIGAFFLTSNKEETITGVTTKFNYAIYGLEASYHFEGYADNAYVALRAGLAKVAVGVLANTQEVSTSPFAYGLQIGYDHPIADSFSLGVEAGWMNIASSTSTVAGLGGVSVNSFNILDFGVAAKVWF